MGVSVTPGAILPRRTLITGLISFVAAPAIVRAASLMPVRLWCPPPDPPWEGFIRRLWRHHRGTALAMLPAEGRAWIDGLTPDYRHGVQLVLNTVGADSFVEHWETHRQVQQKLEHDFG